MEYKITATSCCRFAEPFKIVEKYGEKLANFGATCDDTPIQNFIIPYSEDEYFYDIPTVKVELKTLEELNNFMKVFGKLIISDNRIEIYDDWRE